MSKGTQRISLRLCDGIGGFFRLFSIFLPLYAVEAYNRAMTEFESTILQRIKSSMKARRLTQNDLAASLGVKQYTVSRMLSGAPFPSISQIVKIAEKLDVSVYYLIGIQEESYRELTPAAAKVADAYTTSDPVLQAVVERVLCIG